MLSNEINIGDVILLNDKINNRYKLTKLYDQSIIDEYAIEKYDQHDFQHVYIRNSIDNFIWRCPTVRAHKLLSFYESQIIDIRFETDRTLLYTEYLIIDIDKALEDNEVTVKSNFLPIEYKRERSLLSIQNEIIENYIIGLVSLSEMYRQLEDQNNFYYSIFQIKWPRNHQFRFIGGIND